MSAQHNDHVLSFICRAEGGVFYRWLLHNLGVALPPAYKGNSVPSENDCQRALVKARPEWGWDGLFVSTRGQAAREQAA